jgi:TonB family protein
MPSIIYFGDGYFYPRDHNHMRKVIMATLALFPMLLHAQATPPATTQPAGGASTLQAELGRPKDLVASADTNRSAMPAAAPLRISSGVVAPKLVYSVAVSSEGTYNPISIKQTYVVEMTVGKDGQPSGVKIIESAGLPMNRNVVEAVKHYRFTPGTLDNQPIDFPVKLAIVVDNPHR